LGSPPAALKVNINRRQVGSTSRGLGIGMRYFRFLYKCGEICPNPVYRKPTNL